FCQWYVARVLSPVHKEFSKSVILHYMDDAPDNACLDLTLEKALQAIEKAGFDVQQEKIQRTCPWTYLGLCISKQTTVPQQLAIKDNPKTLRDLQQLCGSVKWVRPLLGLTTEDLALLFNLLKVCDDLDSPQAITKEVQGSIEKVQLTLSSRQVHWTSPDLPLIFII
ncbi:hypothetical protein N302_10320, partial [Corvus brachyrhynchos]